MAYYAITVTTTIDGSEMDTIHAIEADNMEMAIGIAIEDSCFNEFKAESFDGVSYEESDKVFKVSRKEMITELEYHVLRKHINNRPNEEVLISRHEFMSYFRSDKYAEEITPDDAIEIFLTCLKGSSDITPGLLNQLLAEYDLGFESEVVIS